MVNSVREYMTNLFRRRSIIALCAGILTLMLSFYGIVAGIINTINKLGENGFYSFAYFTMLSNTLATLAVAFVLPFAVEGIRKRRFMLPGWVAVIYYIAVCSMTIMMILVLAFMSWAAPESAFGGANIITHVFCPILILTAFFQVENYHIYSPKAWVVGIVPLCIYMIIYYVQVGVIDEANGGWPDIYHIREFMQLEFAIPIVLLMGLATCSVIAILSNFLTKKREAKMYMYWKVDATPIEVKIEAYGLGMMAGRIREESSAQIYFDILEHMAEMYQMDIDELVKPYMAGVMVSRKERKNIEKVRNIK